MRHTVRAVLFFNGCQLFIKLIFSLERIGHDTCVLERSNVLKTPFLPTFVLILGAFSTFFTLKDRGLRA